MHIHSQVILLLYTNFQQAHLDMEKNALVKVFEQTSAVLFGDFFYLGA